MQGRELSIRQKSILMKVFIFSVIFVNLLLVYVIYTPQSSEHQSTEDYKPLFNQYGNKYLSQQQKFQAFSFYENYDELVLENHELNTKYKLGINEIWKSDQDHFYEVYNIIKQIAIKKNQTKIQKLEYDYKNWGEKFYKVKDMKFLKASHIFAVITTIEYWINKDIKRQEDWVELSAQEIIDCCIDCLQSGRPEPVYRYIMENGIAKQSFYPYVFSLSYHPQNKVCRRNTTFSIRYSINNYRKIKKCGELIQDIAHGPVVVGVDGSSWSEYKYGIYESCQRSRTHHAVLVGLDFNYWTVQNSWGEKWGERGFIRLSNGDTCGICLHASVPIF